MSDSTTPHTAQVASLPSEWLDKLEIRELIERSLRYIDDRAGEHLAQLFDDNGVMQLFATVFAGREAIRAMFAAPDPKHWTEPGQLLIQPGSAHHSSNPVIDLDRDTGTATAETDLLVLTRDEEGRSRITLVARYRDRLRRRQDGHWVITNRTGVSIARPSEIGTDAEWARALSQMPEQTRAKFRTQ